MVGRKKGIFEQNIKQHLCQVSLKPLTKFGGNVKKIFWAQPFGLSQISNCFVSLMNKISRAAQISQLPNL